ncbi:MAG: hypothetical protein ACXWIU_08160 [Limisphaerales bacterium]
MDCNNLSSNCGAMFKHGADTYELPRYVFLGPRGGSELIRIGIFAAIHGDEPEGANGIVEFVRLLSKSPEHARGYCLLLYPVCNPTGFEDGTHHSRGGPDLNTHFWRSSSEPEVRLLESELRSHHFHGIITLHSDDDSDGMFGFVRGATLTKYLLAPALEAATQILPLDLRDKIDGRKARGGIVRAGNFDGGLSASLDIKPTPFQISLHTPKHAPQYLQHQAFAIALMTILNSHRELVAYAADL